MSNHVYKQLELTGSSSAGIEDAVSAAIAKAHETVRNIQWFNVTETRTWTPPVCQVLNSSWLEGKDCTRTFGL